MSTRMLPAEQHDAGVEHAHDFVQSKLGTCGASTPGTGSVTCAAAASDPREGVDDRELSQRASGQACLLFGLAQRRLLRVLVAGPAAGAA